MSPVRTFDDLKPGDRLFVKVDVGTRAKSRYELRLCTLRQKISERRKSAFGTQVVEHTVGRFIFEEFPNTTYNCGFVLNLPENVEVLSGKRDTTLVVASRHGVDVSIAEDEAA